MGDRNDDLSSRLERKVQYMTRKTVVPPIRPPVATPPVHLIGAPARRGDVITTESIQTGGDMPSHRIRKAQYMPRKAAVPPRRSLAFTSPVSHTRTSIQRSDVTGIATKSTGLQIGVGPPTPVQAQGPRLRTKGVKCTSKAASKVPSGNIAGGKTAGHSFRGSIQGGRSSFDDSQGRAASSMSSSATKSLVFSRKMATSQQTPQDTRPQRLHTITASPLPRGVSKQSATLRPRWHDADDSTSQSKKSVQPGDGFIKRMGVSSGPRTRPGVTKIKRRQDRPIKVLDKFAHLGNREDGLLVSSDATTEENGSDDSLEEDLSAPTVAQPAAFRPIGPKAARKIELSSPSSDEGEYLTDSDEEIDQLDQSDSSDGSTSQESENVGQDDAPSRFLSVPQITSLTFPTEPFRVLTLSENENEDASLPPQNHSIPPDEIVNAIEALTLPCVRMQKSKSLPFMLRNLRRGFRHRCNMLGIPTRFREEGISVVVHYELSRDSKEFVFETRVDKWLCPLCELFGSFPTRVTLANHLKWDHNELSFHWLNQMKDTWLLRVVIASPLCEERPENLVVQQPTPTPDHHISLSTPRPKPSNIKVEGEEYHSPFPYVTLSPPRGETGTPSNHFQSPLPPRIKLPDGPPTPAHTTRPLQSSSRSRSTTVYTVRERSVTAATTMTEDAEQSVVRESVPRYPTPPPPSNRLGPAAQPPFLPFKSEYGGPHIYYSCRPGGATVFDLLNTLPLEPFGVLAWDVLDREDEIFDSDNVQDEYKVIFALWGRWIILNRNTFVADYYKGTINFVNTYWRMIHRAAGWEALRYWLIMLLANRFLSGAEVAKILKHYEGLVGMEFWD